MVNGLGSQCINYHEEWCAMFVDVGCRSCAYDNRDVGSVVQVRRRSSRQRRRGVHHLRHGDDGIAVLDAIEVERAHVMGLSMGGMIVQMMAIEHPDRLLSMTSVMSRTGEPDFGQSTPEAFALLTAPPRHGSRSVRRRAH